MRKIDINLKLIEIAMHARAVALSQSPIRTGRMVSSIQLVWYDDGFGIIVPEEIFYFKYTDEKWDRASGKANPNEGWFSDRTFNLISNMIAAKLGGSLRKLE